MPVKAKIRFDFRAEAGPKKLFQRRPDIRETAKAVRAEQVALLRNLPFQGLSIEDLDYHYDVYVMPEYDRREEVAYAPVEMVVHADAIGDLAQLMLREEFRKIKVLEPKELALSNTDVERFLFQVAEEYHHEVEQV